MDEGRRKRGRKGKDAIDIEIKEKRKKVSRGIDFLLPKPCENREQAITKLLKNFSHDEDEVIRAVLARELEILKRHELVEVREVDNMDGNVQKSCPVVTRLPLPGKAVVHCLSVAVDHIGFFRSVGEEEDTKERTEASFSPELAILLGKACEQMICELTARAFLNAQHVGNPDILSERNLALSARSAWRSKGSSYVSRGAFDFAVDAIDRMFSEDPIEPLDLVAPFHLKR